MAELKIRRLKESDLEEVIAIERDAFAKPWEKRIFLKELNNSYAYYLVGVYQQKIAAYIGAWFLADRCHITNLATAKAYRRLGFAGRLIEYLCDRLKDFAIKRITLEVRKSNQKAQTLYEKYGFVELGIKKNYYSNNNEDAVLMYKSVER